MLDIVSDVGLSQLQKDPARRGEVLDLLFTSNPSLLKSITLSQEYLITMGWMVVADFYLRAHVNKRPPHSIPLWSRATGILHCVPQKIM